MYESVSLPEKLEIEHIMPRGWRTFWDPERRLDPEEAAHRDRLIHTIGNLTLITKSLNSSLSNRPWTDASSVGLQEGGEPGRGKRALLEKYSLLVLNKEIISLHPDNWSEEAIHARSLDIVNSIIQAWPGPDAELQASALASDRAVGTAASETAPWPEWEVATIAEYSGETLKLVLDTLAADPDKRWTNQEFKDSKITDIAPSALGALTVMVRNRLSRADSPVIFTQRGKTWYWSANREFGEKWRTLRDAGGDSSS